MAAITSKARNALPAKDFAGPDRSYPIDTAGRARNALSRGAQNASPQLQATIRRKVANKYPGIEQSKGPEAKKAAAKPPVRSAPSTTARLAKALDTRLDQRAAGRK
jgi:hypothetical protein